MTAARTPSGPAAADAAAPAPATPQGALMSLLYCSRAAAGMDVQAVQALVAKAQQRNATLGITGLLVYGSGVFFQWLEGPREVVLQLMSGIHTDPRHSHVTEVSRHDDLPERLFPAWGMELVSPSELKEVITDAIAAAGDSPRVAALQALLARVEVARLAGLG
jgi:hypothetical protein